MELGLGLKTWTQKKTKHQPYLAHPNLVHLQAYQTASKSPYFDFQMQTGHIRYPDLTRGEDQEEKMRQDKREKHAKRWGRWAVDAIIDIGAMANRKES